MDAPTAAVGGCSADGASVTRASAHAVVTVEAPVNVGVADVATFAQVAVVVPRLGSTPIVAPAPADRAYAVVLNAARLQGPVQAVQKVYRPSTDRKVKSD